MRKCRKHFYSPPREHVSTSGTPLIWPATVLVHILSMTIYDYWLLTLLTFHCQLRTSCLNLDSTVVPFTVFDLFWPVRDGMGWLLVGLLVCLRIALAINNLVRANCPLAFLLVIVTPFASNDAVVTGANALGRSVTFPETTTNRNSNKHYNWYFSVFCVYI